MYNSQDNGRLLGHEKEGNLDICVNMNGPWEYYAKCNRSDKGKYQMFSFKCGIIKTKVIDAMNRLVVARGGGWEGGKIGKGDQKV